VQQVAQQRGLGGEQRAQVRLEQRDHVALHVGGEPEAVRHDRRHGDQHGTAQRRVGAVEGGAHLALGDEQHLEQRLVAVRPDLPRMQPAARLDRLDVQHLGAGLRGVFAVEQVGGQVERARVGARRTALRRGGRGRRGGACGACGACGAIGHVRIIQVFVARVH
jgi:hypothetical protein